MTMNSTNDLDLLREFALEHSQDAFTTLVQRHVDLVYCAALRRVGSPQLAEEVAQSVFTDLARNAARLKPETILTAWLYGVTRRTAINVVRGEARRQHRERIAAEMNAMNGQDWTPIEPLLDDAMEALEDCDRTAVLLRYFENRSLREVGAALGLTDDTARKRLNRAVERLREYLARRGVAVGAGGLAVVLSTHAVQAAPAGMVVSISTAAAAAAPASTVVQTSTPIAIAKLIAMTAFKKSLIAAAFVLVAGALTLHLNHMRWSRPRSSRVLVANLESYAGKYEMPGHKLILRKKGKGISVGGTDGGVPFVAYPQSENEFVSYDQGSITKLTFAKDASQRVTELRLVRDGRFLGDLKKSEPR
jgi:RNA polymerase sigma factor (sigma-70 family)